MPARMLALLILTTIAACDTSQPAPDAALPTFNIDPDRVTVSGISSGAYMATQLHLAHSNLISGAGLIAGGPYRCADGSMEKALGACLEGGNFEHERIAGQVREYAAAGAIDDPGNLQDDRVWIFHGAADAAIDRSVAVAARNFYRDYAPAEGIAFVDTVDAVHGMPTIAAGAVCDEFAPPYINACDYDAAGELLGHLYGPLAEPAASDGALVTLSQEDHAHAELWDHAYLYAPRTCREGAACGLHVAFHGCNQSAELIGDEFARLAGYNRWAETNDIVVLYPQVKQSRMAPLNPLGCWDWWGYTGKEYATKAGPQVAAVRAMMDALMQKPD